VAHQDDVVAHGTQQRLRAGASGAARSVSQHPRPGNVTRGLHERSGVLRGRAVAGPKSSACRAGRPRGARWGAQRTCSAGAQARAQHAAGLRACRPGTAFVSRTSRREEGSTGGAGGGERPRDGALPPDCAPECVQSGASGSDRAGERVGERADVGVGGVP
jgi:hypothetical protein